MQEDGLKKKLCFLCMRLKYLRLVYLKYKSRFPMYGGSRLHFLSLFCFTSLYPPAPLWSSWLWFNLNPSQSPNDQSLLMTVCCVLCWSISTDWMHKGENQIGQEKCWGKQRFAFVSPQNRSLHLLFTCVNPACLPAPVWAGQRRES